MSNNNNNTKAIFEQLEAKRACFTEAQDVATALALCGGQKEAQAVLDELGFKLTKWQATDPKVDAYRYIYQRNVASKSQAQYIDVFTGVVYAVDYTHRYTDGLAVLDEHAKRMVLLLAHE